MKHALENVTVLETASWVAGPYCGKLLADHGATVIKIEPPEGDPSRVAGPFPGDAEDKDSSGLFLHLNTGKRSVVIDLDAQEDREEVRRLARSADLVIDDGRLADSGIRYEELRELNPGLVWTDVSSFGRVGPYRDYRMNDFVSYAVSGWMAAMGDPERPPVYPGKDYPFYVTGLYAAFGSIISLLHAHRTQQGQRAEVSVLDSAISIEMYEPTTVSYGGTVRRRRGSRVHGIASSLQPCKDGWIALTVNFNRDWAAFCDVLGAPELAEAPYDSPSLRMKHADELERLVRERLATMTKQEVVSRSQERKAAVTPVATPKDIFESEQLGHREWFVDLEHEKAGRITHPGPAFRLSAAPALIGPAPRLGEGSDEVRTGSTKGATS